jgi:acylphosphatase
VHILISGYVQGVGFRYYAQEKAQKLNLLGWVKNNFEGSVEADAQGEEHNIDAFIGLCRKGPPLSHVKDVKIREEPITKEFHEFTVRF